MGAPGSLTHTYDALTALHDTATAITADDAGQVGGSDQIVDLGTGVTRGDMQVDVSAIDVAGGDELYHVILEGSNSPTFASGVVPLAVLTLGDAAVMIGGGDTDGGPGRYIVPFRNERDGVVYRYVRLFLDVTGASASLTFAARLGRSHRD